MIEGEARVVLVEATSTPFSLSSSPIFSGLLAFRKLSLESWFPMLTQYKGNPSRRVGS